MTKKQLKRLRRSIRLSFTAYPKTGHMIPPLRELKIPDYLAPLNLDGTLKMKSAWITGTVTVDPATQRGVYRSMKREYRALGI